MRKGLTLSESPSFSHSSVSMEFCIGSGFSRIGNFQFKEEISVKILNLIIFMVEEENNPMIDFCGKFEAAVAGAYAKEQGEETPPVNRHPLDDATNKGDQVEPVEIKVKINEEDRENVKKQLSGKYGSEDLGSQRFDGGFE